MPFSYIFRLHFAGFVFQLMKMFSILIIFLNWITFNLQIKYSLQCLCIVSYNISFSIKFFNLLSYVLCTFTLDIKGLTVYNFIRLIFWYLSRWNLCWKIWQKKRGYGKKRGYQKKRISKKRHYGTSPTKLYEDNRMEDAMRFSRIWAILKKTVDLSVYNKKRNYDSV